MVKMMWLWMKNHMFEFVELTYDCFSVPVILCARVCPIFIYLISCVCLFCFTCMGVVDVCFAHTDCMWLWEGVRVWDMLVRLFVCVEYHEF